MANGNKGIGGFLPFPTFGGGQEGGGITPVKLAPTRMSFPTAGRFTRRAPEPELKETIAPFLPIAVEGIMGMLKGGPETMTDQEYLDSLGGLSEGTDLADVLGNQKKLAQLQTYQQFGEPEEKDSFGMDEIVNMIIGSQMGRGAKDYAATSMAIDKQKETSRLTEQTNRTAFLKEALKDVNNLQFKNFEDVDKAKVGVSDYRSGFVDPRGEAYVLNDDKSGYTNIKELEGNWVERLARPTTSLSTQLKDPRLVNLNKKDEELNVKDTALLSTMTLTNEMVRMLDKGIDDPSQNPLTMVTSIGNFLNSAKANAEQVLTYVGNGTLSNAFATADDIQNGIAGSNGREGTGDNAERLYAALQSGDDDQIKAAMLAFEQSQAGQEYGVSFLGSLGDMAYNDVRTRATMLQLAYAAAAANGQTGRTLSDKDLAFHLQMVGFGSTQDAQTAKDNILGFVDTLVRQTDNVVMGSISENRIRAGQYPINDDLFTSILSGYWDAPKDQNGKPNFSNMDDVTFRNFFKRYSRIPDVIKYKSHTRRNGTEFDSNYSTGNTVDVAEQLKLDTTSVEQLY